MLEQLKQLALQALQADPSLRREIVQLVGAIDARSGAARTFPSRQERRAGRNDSASYGVGLAKRRSGE
ncbi:MAG TPA: hypothetical protein PKK15_06410 [Kouleothrix sp.]|uniref:hypothetical protein n=1 Tax=Kouleothrix sp. TaxID=2779161 RepID=UPI002BA00158|nr:hypothetical protein [Kouleothrix sp.]